MIAIINVHSLLGFALLTGGQYFVQDHLILLISEEKRTIVNAVLALHKIIRENILKMKLS